MRIFYKSPSGEVFEYGSVDERERFGAEDLIQMTSEEIEEHLNPEPSYQKELSELNATWQKQVDGYNRSFAIASLSDGPTEESKKIAIRADYEAAKLQNTADRAALKAKYGL